MVNPWIEEAKRALYIAEKDVRIYFFKAPNLTFGLLLPVVLYLAFSLNRTVNPVQAIPGLVAMASFFGSGAIQAVSLPLERRTGTFNMLLTAPTSLFTIILGKTLAGFFFGTILSLAYTLIMLPLTSIPHLPLFIIGILISSLMFSVFGLFLSSPYRLSPRNHPSHSSSHSPSLNPYTKPKEIGERPSLIILKIGILVENQQYYKPQTTIIG